MAADGAESWISRQVGIIKDAPNAYGERCFVRPTKARSFKCDYAIHYGKEGPTSVLRQVEDYVSITKITLQDHNEKDEVSVSCIVFVFWFFFV